MRGEEERELRSAVKRLSYSRDRIELPGPGLGFGRTAAGIAAGAVLLALAFVFVGRAAGWFAKDENPPLVTVEVPGEGAKYEGTITVTASVSEDDRLSAVRILLDGVDYTPAVDLKKKKRFITFKLKLDTSFLDDGKHLLEVSAEDKQGNEGSARVEFYADNTPTVVELAFEPPRVEQGRVLGVRLSSNEKLYNPTGELWEQEFPFYETENGYYSILTVRASCPPGEYDVSIRGLDANDEEVSFSGNVVVKDGGYINEYIRLAAEKQKELYDPALEERKRLEAEKVQKILTTWSDEQLWAGKFIVPVEGKFTSPFGTYRTFNTGATERHLGTDIAAKEGKPVRAPNRGRVVLAERLIMRGKCVVIDHGRGVFTVCNHMSDVVVGPGDIVEKGQVVGFVGSTGVATGPHVHWEMRVFRWVTDPLEWTRNVYTYRTPEAEAAAAAEVEGAYAEMLTAPVPEWNPDRDLTVRDEDAGEGR